MSPTETFVQVATGPALLILEAVFILVALSGTAWLRAKTENEHLKGVIGRVQEGIFEATEAMKPTFDLIRESAKDGVIDEEERKKIRDSIVGRATKYVGEKGIDRAKKILGTEALIEQMEAKAEAAIQARLSRTFRVPDPVDE